MATGAARRAPKGEERREEQWMREVTDALASGLRAKLDTARRRGRGPADLGAPAEVAARMLATVPSVAPSPWNALGPFYSTAGVARMLGGVTRQAVDDRRRRGRIVAVRTTDGVWLYPAFQFDGEGRLLPGLAGAFVRLRDGGGGDWMAASFLLAPQEDLGGRSVVEHLAGGGGVDAVERFVDRTLWAWNQ